MSDNYYKRAMADMENKLDVLTSAFIFTMSSLRMSFPTANIPDMDSVYSSFDTIDAVSVKDRLAAEYGEPSGGDTVEAKLGFEFLARKRALLSIDPETVPYMEGDVAIEGLFRVRSSGLASNQSYVIVVKVGVPETAWVRLEYEARYGSRKTFVMLKSHDGRYRTIDIGTFDQSNEIMGHFSLEEITEGLERVLGSYIGTAEPIDQDEILHLFDAAFGENAGQVNVPELHLNVRRSDSKDEVTWSKDGNMFYCNRFLEKDVNYPWEELNLYVREEVKRQLLLTIENNEKAREEKEDDER